MSAPDFVILGVSHPGGGVLVIASKHLTKADLEEKVDDPEFFLGPMVRPHSPTRTAVTAEMNEYVTATAADYAEAMRRLFQFWALAERPALAEALEVREEASDAAPTTASPLRTLAATRDASAEDLEVDSIDELKAGDVVREPATPFSGVRICRPRSRQ